MALQWPSQVRSLAVPTGRDGCRIATPPRRVWSAASGLSPHPEIREPLNSCGRPTDSQEVAVSSREGDLTPGQLLDELQRALDLRQRSARTARAYVHWTREFLQFAQETGATLDEAGAGAFVQHVVRERGISASTRRQAVTALTFFFRHVAGNCLEGSAVSARVSGTDGANAESPLASSDLHALFAQLEGPHWLIAALLVSSGLGLIEACRLRVRDVDLSAAQVTVRQPGVSTRLSLVPADMLQPLEAQLSRSRETYVADGECSGGHVLLPPEAQAESGLPATHAWEWQWLFPGARTYVDPATGFRYRHHQHESGVQRAIRNAGRQANAEVRVTCQLLRTTFAARIRQGGMAEPLIDYLVGRGERAHEAEALRALASLPSPLG